MKHISSLFASILLLILTACTGGKYLETTSTGESLFKLGEFQQVMDLSEQLIVERESRGKLAPGSIYSLAGASAFETGEYDKSLAYLLKAQMQEYSDERMYLNLAKNYRHIDNLSKEISSLEAYRELYPQGKNIKVIEERLFQTCLESDNFELAEELWTTMDSMSKEDVKNLETYLLLNRAQENETLCDSLAARILDKESENEPAMYWIAESNFWTAENTYISQMKAYKENRTHKQYAILLKAFKQVNADFKESRDYFLKLYKLYPKPEYAAYLGNIYTRLEDEKRANYYKKRSN